MVKIDIEEKKEMTLEQVAERIMKLQEEQGILLKGILESREKYQKSVEVFIEAQNVFIKVSGELCEKIDRLKDED